MSIGNYIPFLTEITSTCCFCHKKGNKKLKKVHFTDPSGDYSGTKFFHSDCINWVTINRKTLSIPEPIIYLANEMGPR